MRREPSHEIVSHGHKPTCGGLRLVRLNDEEALGEADVKQAVIFSVEPQAGYAAFQAVIGHRQLKARLPVATTIVNHDAAGEVN